jgi:hypothetical protein
MRASPAAGVSALTPLAGDPVGDTMHLGVRLHCPRCRTDLTGLDCLLCGFHLQNDAGIIDALPPERAAHYARFIEEYERIRAAEGRGGESESFYLGLPYTDISGKNSKQWEIRARSYDCLIEHALKPNIPMGAGRILDLGAGNCWMSFRLTLAGHHPFAVDLLTNDADGMGAAEHYRGHLPGLRTLEEQLSIRWSIHVPRYGVRWAMRPLMATLRNRREPSRFRIYAARKEEHEG